jgi:hypothetical protein
MSYVSEMQGEGSQPTGVKEFIEMKYLGALIVATAVSCSLAGSADAQWATRVYRPVVVAPQPVWIAPQPVWIAPQPMVVQTPPRVYTRHRPILGGTVVRTRPGTKRIIW